MNKTNQTWELSVAPKNYNGNQNLQFKSELVPLSRLREYLISNNFSTIHWDGNRKSDNFLKATGFLIDVDNGLPIKTAERRLVKKNMNYALITSRSHTNKLHKYHIIIPTQYQILSESSYKVLERKIIEEFFPESDQSVKDAARFFYGSPENAEFKENTSGINYQLINEKIWDKNLILNDKNRKEFVAEETNEHTVIFCPFHEDLKPSAWIDYSSKSENYYIGCSACNHTFWMRKDKIALEDRCNPYWSIGTKVIQIGINSGEFYMEDIGEKKFYILTKTNHDKKKKCQAFNYLVDKKHIAHLRRINYLGDINADKSCYQVDLVKGVIDVHIAPIAVDIKDNKFIETYLETTFGPYTQYIKEWLAVYTYSNYQKLPTNIFKGERGVSKSTFAEMVGDIYKPLSSEWHGHEQNFTYEVEKKLLIVEENEISSLNQYKTLKKYSGQKYATVNKKFKDPYEVKNNMNIILLANDNIPLYVNREELPDDERNNQLFVYELPKIKAENRRSDMQKQLIRRLGHYIRTELKDVYSNLVVAGMTANRYSITTPITQAEKELFNDNMTESESYSDNLIQKIMINRAKQTIGGQDKYYHFIEKGFLPVDLIKSDFEIGSHYNAIIKNLKRRRLIKGKAEKKQADGSRFYCYEITNKFIELLKQDNVEVLDQKVPVVPVKVPVQN